MNEYNLSIFDIKEGPEYHAVCNGSPYGFKYRRVGSELQVEREGGWEPSDNKINEMMFKETKSGKKLYAYLRTVALAGHGLFYELKWSELPDAHIINEESGHKAFLLHRMPEFDREIEL